MNKGCCAYPIRVIYSTNDTQSAQQHSVKSICPYVKCVSQHMLAAPPNQFRIDDLKGFVKTIIYMCKFNCMH